MANVTVIWISHGSDISKSERQKELKIVEGGEKKCFTHFLAVLHPTCLQCMPDGSHLSVMESTRV